MKFEINFILNSLQLITGCLYRKRDFLNWYCEEYRVFRMYANTFNRLYLFLCDRYKIFRHIVWKPYLLAFKRSTLYFGTLHTVRDNLIFVKLVSSHFVRSLFYAKTEISLTHIKVTKSYTLQINPLFISFQRIYVPFFSFILYIAIFLIL